MKNKVIFFALARRMAMLALTAIFTFSFVSCGGEDDEPSVDELLSQETTPIDFELQDFESYIYNEYIVFDYAGNQYVGSDTIKRAKCTLNLRRGKHHLIWMKGQYGNKVGFDPKRKTFDTSARAYVDVPFFEMDIDVTPYLMPAKTIECKEHIIIPSCGLSIEATDVNDNGITEWKVVGFPQVKTISLDGSKYELEDRYDGIYLFAPALFTVCPNRGFDKVQVSIELWRNDNLISTVRLPKFNLRPGYITVLQGPLYSGSISDWSETMVPDGEWIY